MSLPLDFCGLLEALAVGSELWWPGAPGTVARPYLQASSRGATATLDGSRQLLWAWP